MNEIKDFDEFYDIKLKPYLGNLRKQSRRRLDWGTVLVVISIIFIPVIVFGLSPASGDYSIWILISISVMLILSIYQYTSAADGYENDFKEHIIRQIIEFIHPGLLYKHDVYINSKYYKNSSLFRAYYKDYYGEDLIEGTYKNVFLKLQN